jgi:hypothetical protein
LDHPGGTIRSGNGKNGDIMLLKQQRQAVELAWQRRCSAEAVHQAARIRCSRCWRQYFSKPVSLIWPFAAGMLLAGLRRAPARAVQVTSLVLSIANLTTRAIPVFRRLTGK